MPTWRNMPSMPKVRASSGTMGTTCLPMFLSLTRAVSMRTSAMVVDISRSPVPSSSALNASSGGTTRGGAALLQVLVLFAVFGRLPERQARELLVGDLNIEAIAHRLEIFIAQFFLLVRHVQAFARLAHPEALDGFRQDHGGRALVGDGGGVGRVHFLRIMATAIQVPNLLIRHVGDHFLELRVFAEEMLAHIGAVLGLEVLVFAV